MVNDSDEILTKKCYKCTQPVLDTLKIVYNPSNSNTFLWNKYQIFVYENIEFECPKKTFVPEFQVNHLIVFNNFIVCLDYNGNLILTSLKFKSSAQNTFKIAFQPREQGIKTCIRYKEDHVLCLKYVGDTYFLCLHMINSDFQLQKAFIIISNSEHLPLKESDREKYLLNSYTVNKNQYEHLKSIFKTEVCIANATDLVILSFDKLAIYSCLISSKTVEDEVMLVKLYCCPAEICSIQVIGIEGLSLLIGLTMGTIIKLSLSDISKTPDVVHLNTALYKMLALKEYILYSDGVTMWKSDHTFTKDVKLTQFFVNNTNDFAKCGDHIICTTFSKLIYKFSLEDQSTYLIPIASDEYCPAEKLLTNTDYINKLFEEINKNNEQVQNLTREQDYLMALALSNRQDVVEKSIESNVLVFESYLEISDIECTLTETIEEYFKPDTWLFLVNIANKYTNNTLNNILSRLSESIQIHVTVLSKKQILKTTSLKIEYRLKTVSFLIPIIIKNTENEIIVNIKIVVNIPNALDRKQTWSVLYRKEISLLSEHFIKNTNKIAKKSMKTPKVAIEDLIQETALVQYGSLFNFTNISTLTESNSDRSFYVHLPMNYKTLFKSEHFGEKYLYGNKRSRLIQQWSAKEFLESKNHIVVEIGNVKVKININDDGIANPLLKVTSLNDEITFNIRNFFSNMINNDYEGQEPAKEFIKYTFYTTAENLQKAIKSSITCSPLLSEEDLLELLDEFEKKIIGALPL